MSPYKQNSCNQPAPNALAPMAIRTTLFDLISGIHAEEGSHVSDGITAAVIDAFKTYHISCLGDFAGSRMILGEQEMSCSAVA